MFLSCPIPAWLFLSVGPMNDETCAVSVLSFFSSFFARRRPHHMQTEIAKKMKAREHPTAIPTIAPTESSLWTTVGSASAVGVTVALVVGDEAPLVVLVEAMLEVMDINDTPASVLTEEAEAKAEAVAVFVMVVVAS